MTDEMPAAIDDAAGFRELQAARGRKPKNGERAADPLDAAFDRARADRERSARTSSETPGQILLRQIDRLAMGAPFFQVDRLDVASGGSTLVKGFDLRLARGQSLCITGPAGAGKSAVLEALFGFLPARAGSVQIGEGIDCADITDASAAQRLTIAKMAFVMQEPSAFGAMTVEENLLIGGHLRSKPIETRRAVDRALERFPHLRAKRSWRARDLDATATRLLEIARALILEPEIVLIDEPAIGLSGKSAHEMYALLRALCEEDHVTLIVAEREGGMAPRFLDIVYEMRDGALVDARRARAGAA